MVLRPCLYTTHNSSCNTSVVYDWCTNVIGLQCVGLYRANTLSADGSVTEPAGRPYLHISLEYPIIAYDWFRYTTNIYYAGLKPSFTLMLSKHI